MTNNLNIENVHETYESLKGFARETALLNWQGPLKNKWFGENLVYLKLEFLQHSGSFKARGAFSTILRNFNQAKKKGVVAVSRGNHGCAVAYAAQSQGISAKIVVPKDVHARRLERCRQFGAEVFLTQDVEESFKLASEIKEKEGRFLVHPFEGESIALATAGIAKEFFSQVEREGDSLDEIYVACGGGGLLAGVSFYSKHTNPSCRVLGVEPTGARSITESLKAGHPIGLDQCESIADSLAAPRTEPYSFSLYQKYTDDIILVDDAQIIEFTKLLYEDLSLVLEPAGVAALAGAAQRKQKRNSRQSIGIILCGANIGLGDYQSL